MSPKIYFKSYKIEKLEALIRRIGSNHSAKARAEKWLATSKAGDRGERSLDYHLSFLDDYGHDIFQGLRLTSGKYHFQIDILLTHPNFFVILEVKNLSGKLIFDTEYNQLIRQQEDREDYYKDPIQQVNHQHFQLENWLKRHRFNDRIPIYSFVVIVNENAKIEPKNEDDLISKKVIRDTKLLDTVISLHNTHKKAFFTNNDLRNLQELLIKKHTPSDPELLNLLKLNKEDLLTGVFCPECSRCPMKRIHGRWICHDCSTISKNAHLQALRDYALLINPAITNVELRKFLHIDSEAVANYLLISLDLDYEGITKSRIYNLSLLQSE